MATGHTRRESGDSTPNEVISTRSGGVDINANAVSVSGDVVGRDKITAGGDVVGRDKITVIIYEGTTPVSVGDLLDACKAQVKSMLYEVRHKYDSNLYVSRTIERELDDFFDMHFEGNAPNCYLIVAPAGSGKTNLLCDMARQRVSRQPVLLLSGGAIHLTGSSGLLGTIQSELQAANSKVEFRSAEDCLHALDQVTEELDRNALLFIDAINEHDKPIEMRKAIEDLLRKTRGKRIKLIMTCRDHYWGLFKGSFWEGATINELPDASSRTNSDDSSLDFSRFAIKEQTRALSLYLSHYKITGRPIGNAAEQCRHPLLLRFFCEAYRGQDIGDVEDIRLKELFDRYWNQKLHSIAERMIQQGDERLLDGLVEEVGNYILNVAAFMLQQNVRAIPVEEMLKAAGRTEHYADPRSIYGRIRDEFIILEEKERGRGIKKILQVAFVYEEFMEYVMAQSLLRDWDKENADEVAILAKVKALAAKYDSIAQVWGVMVYLALMLKEQRNMALWSLLIMYDLPWRKVVLEVIRKLRIEQLDIGVYDALTNMLTSDDEEIQKQALDVLKIQRIGHAAPEQVFSVIGKLVTHSRESISRRAVIALGNGPPQLAIPFLIKAQSVRWLGHFGNQTVRNIEKIVMKWRDKAVEPLVETFNASLDFTDRLSAVELAGSLVRQLEQSAARDQVVDMLLAALHDKYPPVQRTAVMALGKLGTQLEQSAARDQVVDMLLAALRDSPPSVQQAAVEVLGEIGATGAVGPLNTIFKGTRKHKRLREITLEALRKLGIRIKEEDYRVQVVDTLILELSETTNLELRHSIVMTLGQLGARIRGETPRVRIVKSLTPVLQDHHPMMRQCAVEALGELGDTRTAVLLFNSLKDKHVEVRQSAAEVLGKLGNEKAIVPLYNALADREPMVRSIALKALSRLGNPAVNLLVAALRNSSIDVRLGAMRALGRIWQLAPLISLGSNDMRERRHAAKSLGNSGDTRVVDPLIATLRDKSVDVRLEAVDALRRIGSPKALAAVQEYHSQSSA